MSAMKPIGKTRISRPPRVPPRVHPSWLGDTAASPAEPAKFDAPSLRKLWDAVDGD